MTLWNKFVQYVEEQLQGIPSGFKTPIIYGSSCIIELMQGMKIPLEKYGRSKSHPYKVNIDHLEKFLEHIWPIP